MNINKTHIWNITYLGIAIYDTIMSNKETMKTHLNAISNEQSVGYIGTALSEYGLFADAFKGIGLKHIIDNPITMTNASYLGIEIYTAITKNISKPISGTIYIQNPELLAAIKRGTFEQYGGKMSARPSCNPLMNKYAQELLDSLHIVMERRRIAWAESHIGSFEYADPNAVFEGSNGIIKPTIPFIQPRAAYYWDKNGRLGYSDDAIRTHYKGNSEDKDPLNGKPTEYNLLNIIARNKRAKEAGEYPENTCLACGESLPIPEPGRRGPKQQYCKDCKKEINIIQAREKIALKRYLRGQQGEVPSRDQSFERYAMTTWIGTANNEPLNTKSITRGSIIKTSEAKGKTADREYAEREPCECGSTEIESYKPWKPEGNSYGKIGSTILYCKGCGLVIDNKPQRSQSEKGNQGYMGD